MSALSLGGVHLGSVSASLEVASISLVVLSNRLVLIFTCLFKDCRIPEQS
jgi:hypothetical protein